MSQKSFYCFKTGSNFDGLSFFPLLKKCVSTVIIELWCSFYFSTQIFPTFKNKNKCTPQSTAKVSNSFAVLMLFLDMCSFDFPQHLECERWMASVWNLLT